MPSTKRAKKARPDVQRPTAAAGETPVCTSGKDASWVMELDRDGNVCRLVWSPVPFNPFAYKKLGIPIDPATWCEPSHLTCDLNPDVPLPEWTEERWSYGDHPQVTRSRRPTRFCVPCYLSMGHESECWAAVEEMRAEAARLLVAA